MRCLEAAAQTELSRLFQAAGKNEGDFVLIEDKEEVGLLHIHMLQVRFGRAIMVQNKQKSGLSTGSTAHPLTRLLVSLICLLIVSCSISSEFSGR